jgi:hypothetical protein
MTPRISEQQRQASGGMTLLLLLPHWPPFMFESAMEDDSAD